MSMLEKLLAAQAKARSMLCLGLDPRKSLFLTEIAQQFDGRTQPLVHECLTAAVRSAAPFTCAFKVNAAYYMRLGPAGLLALKTICTFIKKEYPDHFLILDGEFGGVGDTAAIYAEFCREYQPDAVTISMYSDPATLNHFLNAGLGVFSRRFMFSPETDLALFANHIGIIAGTADLESLNEACQYEGLATLHLMSDVDLQAGNLKRALNVTGNGPVIISISPEIIHASSIDDYAKAAGDAAEANNRQINDLRPAAD